MDIDNKDSQTSDDTATVTSASPTAVSTHTLRQAQLGKELQELNKALALKQELAEKMSSNDDKMAVVKIQYEVGPWTPSAMLGFCSIHFLIPQGIIGLT